MSDAEEMSKLEALTAKMNELYNAVQEKKGYAEDCIKKNPLAYVAGAFAGGLLVGYLLSRRKSD